MQAHGAERVEPVSGIAANAHREAARVDRLDAGVHAILCVVFDASVYCAGAAGARDSDGRQEVHHGHGCDRDSGQCCGGRIDPENGQAMHLSVLADREHRQLHGLG